jgi:KipI family sensor histidine kinase inhibitor
MKPWKSLGDQVLLVPSEQAIAWAQTIQDKLPDGILEAVATDVELSVFFDKSKISDERAFELISGISVGKLSGDVPKMEIPVCYDLGLDWDDIEKQTSLSKEEIISIHTSGIYRVNYGFMPGFIYLSGLDTRMHCARRTTPRTRIPAGAVGIGGDKTGVYSLNSPGGWQILGQTPMRLFDANKPPHFAAPNGSEIVFRPISKKEFDEYERH